MAFVALTLGDLQLAGTRPEFCQLPDDVGIAPDKLFILSFVWRVKGRNSSQIVGTQIALEDVLQFEADARRQDIPKDVEEDLPPVRL